jgi:hypothetical protein
MSWPAPPDRLIGISAELCDAQSDYRAEGLRKLL